MEKAKEAAEAQAGELAEQMNRRIRRSAAERRAELDRQRDDIVRRARDKMVWRLSVYANGLKDMVEIAEGMPEIGPGETLEMMRALRLHTIETMDAIEGKLNGAQARD